MAYKQKGFPMHSTKSALKQTTTESAKAVGKKAVKSMGKAAADAAKRAMDTKSDKWYVSKGKTKTDDILSNQPLSDEKAKKLRATSDDPKVQQKLKEAMEKAQKGKFAN